MSQSQKGPSALSYAGSLLRPRTRRGCRAGSRDWQTCWGRWAGRGSWFPAGRFPPQSFSGSAPSLCICSLSLPLIPPLPAAPGLFPSLPIHSFFLSIISPFFHFVLPHSFWAECGSEVSINLCIWGNVRFCISTRECQCSPHHTFVYVEGKIQLIKLLDVHLDLIQTYPGGAWREASYCMGDEGWGEWVQSPTRFQPTKEDSTEKRGGEHRISGVLESFGDSGPSGNSSPLLSRRLHPRPLSWQTLWGLHTSSFTHKEDPLKLVSSWTKSLGCLRSLILGKI